MLVYSIADERSFQNVSKWHAQVRELAPKEIKIILVGNKADLESERAVSYEAGKEYADLNGLGFFEVSALSGKNVREVFQQMGERILQDLESPEPKKNLVSPSKEKSCCGRSG